MAELDAKIRRHYEFGGAGEAEAPDAKTEKDAKADKDAKSSGKGDK